MVDELSQRGIRRTRQSISERCKSGNLQCIYSDKGYLIPESELQKLVRPPWSRGRPRRPNNS